MGRHLFSAREDALWRAASKLDDKQLRELLVRDPTSPQLNQVHATKCTTPLMAACRNKKSRRSGDRSGATVQYLLEFGADVNVVDRTGHKNTALHYAAYANASIATEYLLHAGANALALNHKAHTPLDVARLHGRRQSAAVLTQHLSMKSGWLDVCGTSLLPVWRRRWCVVLACNAERTSFELCMFHSPDDALPEHVLHIDPASRAELYSGSSSLTSLWLTKPYMFTLDRPLVLQGVSGRRFSRDPVTGLTQGHGAVQVRNVQFAAENEQSCFAWMAQLGNGAHLAPTPTVFASAPRAGSFVGLVDTSANRATPLSPLRLSQPVPRRNSNFDLFVAPIVRPTASYTASGSFSPPPHQFLDSPTTIVPAFTDMSVSSSAVRTPPASAPSFDASMSSSDAGFYRGPGSHVSTRTSGSSSYVSPGTTAAGIIIDPRSSAGSLENVTPNAPAAAAVVLNAQQQTATVTTTTETGAKVGGSGQDCVICMDAVRDAICVPCGHIAGCHNCLSAIKRQSGSRACCPICRALVATVVKIYDC